MASKVDNELLKSEESMEQSSNITYANEVVSTIAGLATVEIKGIAGMSNGGGSLLNKKRNLSKGVKVEIGTEEVSVDLYIIVEYGTPIQKAAQDAQENVRKAIESMTGLHVVRVDVHIQGVSFEQERQTLEAGVETSVLSSGDEKKAESASTEVKTSASVESATVKEEKAAAVDAEPKAETEEAADEVQSCECEATDK